MRASPLITNEVIAVIYLSLYIIAANIRFRCYRKSLAVFHIFCVRDISNEFTLIPKRVSGIITD